jgi:hypothetical protein
MKRFLLLVAALFAFTLAAAPDAVAQKAAKKQLLANATVKSLSASSLTVTANGADSTFAIDAKTRVVGKGVGTKSAAKGGKASIADLLKEGDHVTVTYTGSGSAMQATLIEKR